MSAESAELMTHGQAGVAKLIAKRLTKVKGTKYVVVKITQVSEFNCLTMNAGHSRRSS